MKLSLNVARLLAALSIGAALPAWALTRTEIQSRIGHDLFVQFCNRDMNCYAYVDRVDDLGHGKYGITVKYGKDTPPSLTGYAVYDDTTGTLR